MSRFLGITRERVFSPGRVEDDRAVLELVADQLRRRGAPISVCDADDARWPEPTEDTVVFAMCQGDVALQHLQQWERRGVRIVNRPSGILNCQRHRTVAAFADTDIPFPATVLVDTDAQLVLPPWSVGGRAWVKRGDVHATEADDVVAVEGVDAVRQALHRFRERGIPRAVVQQHVPGAVLKFYAVRGRFFHCVPPRSGPVPAADTLQRIDEIAQRAARRLNLEVYGGDCVSEINGGLQIIDLNDWPSYAPCRAEAAAEIAAYLHAQKVASDE